MAKRRRLNVFSLAFLDIMSCGFGAVILIFLIINHATERDFKEINRDQLAEIRMLDYEVQQGEKDKAELQQELDELKRQTDERNQALAAIIEDLARKRQDLDELEATSMAEVASIEALKADIETREKELDRLRALEQAAAGDNARSFVGEGDRQYLTGLSVAGRHIVIAIDVSASMLDDTIVNVIRRRNMKPDAQRSAPKWRRAIRTVEWLASQVPLDSDFQLIAFNTEAASVLPESNGAWLPVSDTDNLDRAVSALEQRLPADGTSLERLAETLAAMSPLPDNVYLITDSLPTQGLSEPRRATISGRDRLKLFNDAARKMPRGVRVNVIMFPMEGDPLAAAAFWNLARTSGGAYISPSRDWP